MSELIQHFCHAIHEDGYAMIPNVLTPSETDAACDSLMSALSDPNAKSAIRSQAGTLYAARNVLDLWPESQSIWKTGPLPDLLRSLLGEDFGLVRGLFFDKPPRQTWALGWHKDRTIAVVDNTLESEEMTKPTRKANVPHVDAPEWLLQEMLTVRIHLDPMTAENGPLMVIPGSHKTGKKLELGTVDPVELHANQGDALLIRPLVAHSSRKSEPETTMHRRVLHLEFAGQRQLPDGYQWHQYF